MTTPTTSDLLKYADLQMAAEAFLVDPGTGAVKPNLRQALIDGNTHASRFTSVQATRFLEYWEVVAQQENTKTGFRRQRGQVLPFAPRSVSSAGSGLAFCPPVTSSASAGSSVSGASAGSGLAFCPPVT